MIEKNGEEISSLICEKDAIIFICGSTSMGNSVTGKLELILGPKFNNDK